MNYYAVTIITKGKKEEFYIYAKDKKEANTYVKLKFSGIIIRIVQRKEPLDVQLKKVKTNLLKNIKKRKIKPDLLIASIRQLAVMTNAGISIYDSLSEIAKSTDDKTLKYVFTKLSDEINYGHSLSSSMENFRFELGNLSIAMADLGEKTGNLDESLYALADMLEEVRSNYIKFKKAMTYPRNVIVAMLIAFVILISFVVPKFKSIFEQLNAQLPLPTQVLLGLENLFNNYGLYLLAIILTSYILSKYLINTNINLRFWFHSLLLKIYLIKNIIKFSTLNRFTIVFSELIRAGIPIAEALDTSIGMIDNLVLKEKLLGVRNTVEKGGTLNNGLKETNLFENMTILMIRSGEDSGTLDTMTQKVAQYYKMRFDSIIEGVSGAIEPIMLFIVASMITLLALGIFLPIWGLGSAVGV
ncbi:MAG: type II secretion system F family protein [Sulfurimonas sp.]|nr:type II secretion system F family protein [Sulfurimonas sp.]